MTQKHTPEPWVQQETRIMFDGEIIAIVKPSEFALFDAAKEMHKQEIESAYWAGFDEDKIIHPSEDCNGYYNQTFEQ